MSKTATTIKPQQQVQSRRSGVIRQVVGFTTKPTPSAPSDGIRRVRLVEPLSENETRVRADQLFKSYRLVNA